MKLKPLGERVILQKVEVESKTKSGIILPDEAKEKPQYAEVVALGDKIDNASIDIHSKVVYKKYSGTEISLDGKDYIVIELEDLLAVIE
ncbi:MAG TPA: co-chaperone GroES [Clostridia bacterium]|nr:co-chaperone GroES [Clostridia bacterium]